MATSAVSITASRHSGKLACHLTLSGHHEDDLHQLVDPLWAMLQATPGFKLTTPLDVLIIGPDSAPSFAGGARFELPL